MEIEGPETHCSLSSQGLAIEMSTNFSHIHVLPKVQWCTIHLPDHLVHTIVNYLFRWIRRLSSSWGGFNVLCMWCSSPQHCRPSWCSGHPAAKGEVTLNGKGQEPAGLSLMAAVPQRYRWGGKGCQLLLLLQAPLHSLSVFLRSLLELQTLSFYTTYGTF